MRNKILFALSVAALLKAQTPAPPDKPATLEGVVTHANTGEPLPRVHVILRGNANGTQRQYGALTAPDGHFSVIGISPGRYTITAERVGFVMPPGPPGFTGAVLKADEKKSDFTLKLFPTGALTGRVTDSDGEPVQGATVFAEGNPAGDSSSTDEKGQFRIGGLAPGRYRIRAAPNSQTGFSPEIRSDGTVDAHLASTYYPGVLTAKEAGRVEVRSDGETGGVDIRLVRVPWIHVSGTVIGPFQSTERVYVSVQRTGTNNAQNMPGAVVKPDGKFEMWRLDPGRYQFIASWTPPGGQYMRSAPVDVEVAGSNIDKLELRFIPNFDLAGRLEHDSDEAKQLPQQQPKPHRALMLRDVTNGSGVAAQAQVQDDDTFHFSKVPPGRYRVLLSWNTPAYVRSTRLASTTSDGSLLDLTAGSNGMDLSIMLAAANASISGTVQDEQEKPMGSLVILVQSPADAATTPRYAVVKPDGTYEFAHVPPGGYRIVATQKNDMIMVQQPGGTGLLDYEDQMESVEIHAGDKLTKDLKRRPPL